MASQTRRVGVVLRAPNYSCGSCSLPASPSAPMFGCIFPGRVRRYAPLASTAPVSGGAPPQHKARLTLISPFKLDPLLAGYIVNLFVDSYGTGSQTASLRV